MYPNPVLEMKKDWSAAKKGRCELCLLFSLSSLHLPQNQGRPCCPKAGTAQKTFLHDLLTASPHCLPCPSSPAWHEHHADCPPAPCSQIKRCFSFLRNNDSYHTLEAKKATWFSPQFHLYSISMLLSSSLVSVLPPILLFWFPASCSIASSCRDIGEQKGCVVAGHPVGLWLQGGEGHGSWWDLVLCLCRTRGLPSVTATGFVPSVPHLPSSFSSRFWSAFPH